MKPSFLKTTLYLSVLCFGSLLSCEPDNPPSINPFDLPPTEEGVWRLMNSTGVGNGVDHDFPNNLIRWQFTPPNGELKIVNNNLGGAVFDGPSSGEYPYELRKSEGESYLFISDLEFGQMRDLTDSTFVIDQRFTLGDPINDPHILSFQR